MMATAALVETCSWSW